MIADTDHYRARGGDALWAWKSFLRGHHPILMDFGIIGGVNPPDPTAGGPMSFETFEPARFAMGDTVRYAERVGLIEMEPRGDLSSTGYAAGEPGRRVPRPPAGGGRPFTVTLEPGTYEVEWFDVDDCDSVEGGTVSSEEGGPMTFEPPFAGSSSVLYLRMA